ncbi:MAG: hypothetical protein QF471_04020 [Phycisphaerales bacterium]|nr:hypothetical protein [Phycisphaerales bacterium]
MHRSIHNTVCLALLMVAAVGCSQSKNVSSVNSASQISGAEFRDFGNLLVDKLGKNRVLLDNREEYGRKPVIMWTRMKNTTNDPQISRSYEFMYNSLQEALVNSGAATITDRWGGADKRNQYANDVDDIDMSEDAAHDYTISGKASKPTLLMAVEIVEAKTVGRKGTQYDYDAKVVLTDASTKEQVWIGLIPVPPRYLQ